MTPNHNNIPSDLIFYETELIPGSKKRLTFTTQMCEASFFFLQGM